MKTVSLKEVCQISMGQAPDGSSYNDLGEGFPLIAGAGDFGPLSPKPKKFTTEPTRVSEVDDIILCIRATIGDLNWSDKAYCLGRGVAGLRPNGNKLDRHYLWHWLTSQKDFLFSQGTGSTFKQISRSTIDDLQLPLPPLPEQKRIAAILDKADAIRRKRQQAVKLTEELLRSVFLDMFGDPALNPKRFPYMTIGELASKFSDGPFGSNLKSSHYQKTGVRVIRLQNIGVGKFMDDDNAFISEEHFTKLKKHECRPGDVIIGTLGDPNLRAFVQPDWLPLALNKADCVQLRPDSRFANSTYLCALLNQPETEKMAQDLILGQTRLRISMGRLRNLKVPVPSLDLQNEFAHRVATTDKMRKINKESKSRIDTLFTSLLQRAFRGEL